MARHTIGSKRGSVRGAPPNVYLPFGSFADDDDRAPWQDSFELAKGLAITAVLFVVLMLFCLAYYALTEHKYK